mgnify:CR=1 FL=1
MMVEKNHTGELFDRLENGVEDMYRSGRYEEYLKTMSKFHSYSARNCVLIMQQKGEHPDLKPVWPGNRQVDG